MSPHDRDHIAAALRQAREAAGLSQGQAARRLGLHRPTVSEIEAGRRRVSAEELKAFADLYRVDVAWILSGGTASPAPVADEVLLAARRLSRWSDDDLGRLEELIRMIRRGDEP